MKLPRINKELDWTLVVVPILLAIAGVATLYSITSVSGKTYLASSQIIYIGVGAVIYFLLMLFDYREFRSFYSYLFIFGVILLFVVDFVGLSIFGSRRWIDLGFFQFQPSELMKLIFLFFAGSFFAKDIKPTLLNVLYFLVLTAIPVLLIMKEPDLGTALTILFGVLIIFFAVKVPMKIIIGGLILIALISPFVWMKLKPYQKSRVTAFIEPNLDTLGSGYNVSQAKIAVGSGGLFGKGFGGATQSQLQFLPVAHIDFIFSGWAEATGFVGSVILTGAFAILIWRIFAIANLSRDKFGYIFCTGAASFILFQALVNIGMNIGIMPVTGIPLPLVSYGGTSVIIESAILGVVQSIYLRRKALKFD